eukprot:scaffold649_cov347-Pavlova_lutheri.AAC.26
MKGWARLVGQRDCCNVLGSTKALFEHARQRNAREMVALQKDRHTHSNGFAQPSSTTAAQLLQ